MAEAPVFSPISLAVLGHLIKPKLAGDDSLAPLQSIFNTNTLQAYVLEIKKAITIMRNNHPVEINTPFKGNCLQVTRDGQCFIFGSIEGRIGIVDINTTEILQDMSVEGGSIYSIALYNRDYHLIAAGKDGKIRKFDLEHFVQVHVFEGHEKEVNSVLISVDESLVYSASDDCSVRAWSLTEPDLTKVIYYHNKAVLCMDQSLDGSYLATGGADKQIKIFNLQNEVVEKSLTEYSTSVWAVKFSRTCKYLAGGDSAGEIKIWDLADFSVYKSLSGHESRISHLEFTWDQNVLVSSSNDTTLRVWDLIEDKKEVVMTGHTDWVKDFKFSADEKTIYSIAENHKILSWKFPRLENSFRRLAYDREITGFVFCRKNNLVFTTDSQEISAWTVEGKTKIKSLNTGIEICAICGDSDNETLMIAYSNYEIVAWNIESELFVKKTKHNAMITCLLASSDGSLLAVGDINFRVTVYKKLNYKILNTFRRHNNIVTVLTFAKPILSEVEKLFSGGQDKSIFFYNLLENTCTKFPNAHSSSISCLLVSRNNEILISGDTEGTFKIWNIFQSLCVKSLSVHSERISGIYFTENIKYFWIASEDSSISLWNIVSYSEVTRIRTKKPVKFFWNSKSELDLITVEGGELFFLENPLQTRLFYVYGPGADMYGFVRYILNLCDDNDQIHDPEMDKWIITPYEINALHFYAYFNLPLHIKAAMNNRAPFFTSRSDYSPLTIAIHRNFRDSINVITKAIRLRIVEDPYSVSYLEEHVVKLNEIGFKGLDEFYSSILFKSTDKLLPKFCDDSVDLPIVYMSKNLTPQQTDFFPAEMVTGFGRPLTFWQSALKINTTIGSSDSIVFLESLLACPNTTVFTSEFVKELILYKWKYVKWALLPQAFTYFVYMIFLSVYMIVYDGHNNFILSCILALNILLALYEVFQVFLTGSNYIKDPWNYIDFIRTTLCFIYTYFVFGDFSKFVTNQLLVSVTFVTMVRGISYFRLFDNTRYMINLLSEVIKDIKSFLILLAYSTYSFALIYFIMVNNIMRYRDPENYEPKSFSEYVANAYLLNLGNFSTDNYEAFEWLIFFFASVINPLIMLNLLISIMGDTFGRVKEEQAIADMKELTEMVVEGEYILFCKRNRSHKCFLQICKEEELTNVELDIDSKLAKLKEKIRIIEESVDVKGQEILQEVRDNIAGVNVKVDEITGIIEQISLTQD